MFVTCSVPLNKFLGHIWDATPDSTAIPACSAYCVLHAAQFRILQTYPRRRLTVVVKQAPLVRGSILYIVLSGQF